MTLHFTIKQDAYAAIEAKCCCLHEHRQLRLRKLVDGRSAYYKLCLLCGAAGQALSKKDMTKELGTNGVAPPFDPELEPQWFATKRVEYVKTLEEITPRLGTEYEAYLQSTAWKLRRAGILRRAAGTCECCKHYAPNEVHHVTYARIGHELDTDLMAVCSFCHALLHQLVTT